MRPPVSHNTLTSAWSRSDVAANVRKCAHLNGQIAFVFTDARVRAAHEAHIRDALPHARVLTTSELATLHP